MKVTLDTNILISGSFWIGDSYRILSLIEQGALELVLSEAIINEYLRALQYEEIQDKIKAKKLTLLEGVEKVLKEATLVSPTVSFNAVPSDPDDNIILECAVEGEIDYIISKDMHLLKLKSFKGIQIVTPTEFLDLIKKR
jgi:putative PIN family toxin of toxin-antitoxin system